MKLSHVLGYTLAAIWWLIVVCLQVLVPTTFVLGITVDAGFLALSLILLIAAAPLTAWSGGLNTVPSILWRFRKNIQTRIVEHEGHYALQMKVFGGWIYVDASEGETGSVMTGWIDDLSAYPFILNKKSKVLTYLDRLETDIQEGFKVSRNPPEVISVQTITNGNIVKN